MAMGPGQGLEWTREPEVVDADPEVKALLGAGAGYCLYRAVQSARGGDVLGGVNWALVGASALVVMLGTECFYLIDWERRVLVWTWRVLGLGGTREVARLDDVTAVGVSCYVNHLASSSSFNYFPAMILNSGKVVQASGARLDALQEANDRAAALAEALSVPFLEGREGQVPKAPGPESPSGDVGFAPCPGTEGLTWRGWVLAVVVALVLMLLFYPRNP